ncbi:mfs transporter [Moniliophthora roreri]|nr:mfs transporter [Moniliophthora roreri]
MFKQRLPKAVNRYKKLLGLFPDVRLTSLICISPSTALSDVDLHGVSKLGHVRATHLNPKILVLPGDGLLPGDCPNLKPITHFPWSMIHQVTGVYSCRLRAPNVEYQGGMHQPKVVCIMFPVQPSPIPVIPVTQRDETHSVFNNEIQHEYQTSTRTSCQSTYSLAPALLLRTVPPFAVIIMYPWWALWLTSGS